MTLLFATTMKIDLHDYDHCLELFSIDTRSYQDLIQPTIDFLANIMKESIYKYNIKKTIYQCKKIIFDNPFMKSRTVYLKRSNSKTRFM